MLPRVVAQQTRLVHGHVAEHAEVHVEHATVPLRRELENRLLDGHVK